MKQKPDLGFWKLWNLSFGFFGVQIAYALQSANVSRIFTTIGADPHDLSYFWILPPLMGLIVQPVVGMLSDRTWNRFGRRLPYLIVGALVAVLVMCLLPNAGSFEFTVQSAILIGLIALMLLDTSINMAMQPFKMLVGDMVNEKQKAKAYSIQSFLCNAGSIVGYILPILLVWFGLKNTAKPGVVPDTVIWAFYIGAAVLAACVIYSLVKIKEWPPKEYNEYNGIVEKAEKKEKNANVITLLKNAPSTFWTVGLVQFFCWFAFLFLWTYSTNTVAHNAFDTPEVTTITGIMADGKKFEAKNLIANDSLLIIDHGTKMVAGVRAGGNFYPASTVVINATDTIVSNHAIVLTAEGIAKQDFGRPVENVSSLAVDGTPIEDFSNVEIMDYMSQIDGPFKLTTAAIVSQNPDGSLSIDEATSYNVQNPAECSYVTRTVLNAASPQYNNAGNWVGLLYAIQALGSVIWAVFLPRFKSLKFSYILSLLLGAGGFLMTAFVTNQYLLFIAFALIGCAWAAMLAWPFTILTNSLKSGNIGTYLGLFNCTITIPQIIAAIAGGWILSLFSTPGQLAPEYLMMMVAGISLVVGSLCVFIIRTNHKEETPVENPVISEEI